MKQIQYTASPGIPPRSMDEEFLCHRRGSEWWYCTGILEDESGALFSYQFTIARIKLHGMQIYMLMTAVTDFQTKKHYYAQHPILWGRDVVLMSERVALNGVAEMTFTDGSLGVVITEKGYSLSLALDVVKPRVWHCDRGVLKMGVDAPKERTYYWSYTNLAASGRLTLGNEEHNLTGKAWFDKQGGTYTLTSRWTNWEWFSMRFFDGEEVMLFSFPQDDYQDGTYIEKSGDYRRLNEYNIKPLGFTEAAGQKFSFGWEVDLKGIKGGLYKMVPKMDGQLNLFYYEMVADIQDEKGKHVGYCMVELLPGVYNEKISSLDAFVRVK